jgi:hypothetical protein
MLLDREGPTDRDAEGQRRRRAADGPRDPDHGVGPPPARRRASNGAGGGASTKHWVTGNQPGGGSSTWRRVTGAVGQAAAMWLVRSGHWSCVGLAWDKCNNYCRPKPADETYILPMAIPQADESYLFFRRPSPSRWKLRFLSSNYICSTGFSRSRQKLCWPT